MHDLASARASIDRWLANSRPPWCGRRKRFQLALMSLLALSPAIASAQTEKSTIVTRTESPKIDGSAAGPSAAARKSSQPLPRLSLRAALQKALSESPELKARAQQMKADAATMLVDEGYANPNLSVEVEDFLGSGVARGIDSTQVTVALSQELQLGGKPGAREGVKRARTTISSLEYRLVEHATEAEVAFAFLDVLAQQERLKKAQAMSRIAQQTLTVVHYQVEAGKATPIEEDKASIAQTLVDLALEESRTSLQVARQALAAACGQTTPFFGEVEGNLDDVPRLPAAPPSLQSGDDRHPALQLERANGEYQRAVTALQETQRVPDLTFSLGGRWIHETRDRALIAGVELALPVVNRQRGIVQAGRHLVKKAAHELERKRLATTKDKQQIYQRLVLAHRRAILLRHEVSPKVRSTYEAVRDGYRIGRFGYLDLLDAQAARFDVEERALEAVVAYHRTFIELMGATGLRLPTQLFGRPSTAPGE